MKNTLIVIPARIGSTRLPNKVLEDINGKPLILRAYECAAAANIGKVVVACDDERIQQIISNTGGTAILTDPELPSGTDRIHSAWQKFDPNKNYEYVVNVQGDIPGLDPEFVRETVKVLEEMDCDIATAGVPIKDDSYLLPSVVKPVISFDTEDRGRALYFSRNAVPYGGPYYFHVGLYGFHADSLEKFVALPQSKLEKTERLEQLRALENGMTIGIKILDKPAPISIDTHADLDRARAEIF